MMEYDREHEKIVWAFPKAALRTATKSSYAFNSHVKKTLTDTAGII